MTADISLQDHFTVHGRFWQRLHDGRVQCDVCPRECRLHEGQRGPYLVRGRVDGQIVLTSYGRSSGSCRLCQNWDVPGRYDRPGGPMGSAAAAGVPGRKLIGACAHIRGRRRVPPR